MDLHKIQQAKQAIASYVKFTPLIRSYELELLLKTKARIFLKCENLQITHSFKPRGAYNVLLHLTEKQKRHGVISRSAGNFAQGLALAGQTLAIRVVIVMPTSVPRVKKDQTEQYGAAIYLHGISNLDQQIKAQEIAQQENLTLLSPFDHLDVIAGQGTIALEVFKQLPTITHYFCPIGGGGLMAGTATAFKQLNPNIETIGIEPQGANDYYQSRIAHKRIRNVEVNTIADGLRAPEVGELCWPLLEKYVDRVECVSDDQIKQTLRFLYEKMGLVLEPSGATSVAGLIFHKDLPKQGDIVCMLSGANVDMDNFDIWIEEIPPLK